MRVIFLVLLAAALLGARPMPCARIAAAKDGDVVDIEAGEYVGPGCAVNVNRLTIRGVKGRVIFNAGGRSFAGKGILLLTGDYTTVENIEFINARSADRNGAGIRQTGNFLTVRNCRFTNNEEGILTNNDPRNEVTIEQSEFSGNGAEDGQAHNVYVGRIARLTFRFNWSHSSRVGHLLKSRAAENYILYNRLSEEADGNGSYELDLPEAGRAWVIGNIIQQGIRSQNPAMLRYGAEVRTPRPSHLFIAHNTFVNDEKPGATFVMVNPGVEGRIEIRNNVFFGAGTITNSKTAVLDGNYRATAEDVENLAELRLRPKRDSGILKAARALPAVEGLPLKPESQYLHPASGEPRPPERQPAAGAFQPTTR